MSDIRIGIVGCGGVSQGHMSQIKNSEGGVVHSLCDINPNALKASGDKYGVPVNLRFADYRDLIACETVDAIDICTPNNIHVPVALAAVDAGKPFCIEKPLGISFEETLKLKRRADKKGVPSMICFSYRFLPATRYAKHLVEQGKIGNVINIYAQYLKSSAFIPGRRLDWRFIRKIARYGVSGDLGVHILDLASFLAGDITGIFADTGIVVKERKRLDSEEIAPVETDDWCHFLARFEGGASATFSITRAAYGNSNHIKIDVYGDRGALRFDLNDSSKLEIYDGTGDINKMETLAVPDEYRAGQQQTFIDLLRGKRDKYIPTLEDGVKMQRILDAIMESSETRKWIDIV